MSRLRMAVIGVGHLGKAHARILASLPEVELVGVVDTSRTQAEQIAALYQCQATTDLESLLPEIDAACVVVPTIHHWAVARVCLEAGIPILVEKPIAPTIDEADRMIELAHRRGVPLQVGHIERFNPAFEELLGRTMQPKFIEAERHGPFTGRSLDIGAVLDLMIHDLDLLLALNRSEVLHVDALGASVFGGHEDIVNARLTFANGCIAHVTASRVSPNPKRRLRIWAPEGYAGIDFVKRTLTLVQPSHELKAGQIRLEHMTPESRAAMKEQIFGRVLQVRDIDCNRGDQLMAELQHFVECVRFNKTPRVTGQDGRNALALAERVLQSVRTHRWQGIEGPAMGPNQMPRPLGWLFEPSEHHREAA